MSWFDDKWDEFWDGARDVGKSVVKTIEQVIEHPLPTIATIALTMAGVPPPVASAMVTYANGGSIEDTIKSAVISYAAEYVGSKASDYVGAAGPTQGPYVATPVEAAIIKISSSAVGASVAGTTIALAQGKTFDQALAEGKKAAVGNLTTSIAGQATNYILGESQTLKDISKLPGGNALVRATSNALISGALGQDASASFKNSLVNSFVKSAGKAVISGIKDGGEYLQNSLAQANAARDELENNSKQQQAYIDNYNEINNSLVASSANIQQLINKANENPGTFSSNVLAANAAIALYNTEYDTKIASLAEIENNIKAAQTSYQQQLEQYNTVYQPAVTEAVDQFADLEAKNTAFVAAGLENYNKALQEYTDIYGKAPTEEDLSRITLVKALEPGQVAANIDSTDNIPRFVVTRPATKDSYPDFDVSKLPKGTELATGDDVLSGRAYYDLASNAYYVDPVFGNADIGDLLGRYFTPLSPLENAPPLPDNTVTNVDLILKDLEIAPPLPDNTVTEVDLTKPDYYLDPVTITGKRLPPDEELDFSLLDLEQAPPLPDNTVTQVDATKATDPLSSGIKIPNLNLRPTASQPSTTARVKPVATPATPATSTVTPESLLQDTLVPLPTSPTDIQYYLNMERPELAVPVVNPNAVLPTTAPDELESLLDQSAPQSLDDLLQHLRS